MMNYSQLVADATMEMPANSSSIHISDVIEIIETDSIMDIGLREKPYIKILEQPASKALRFRYECEGRSAGSIPGVNSTPENKTFPTIQIMNHKGPVVVIVSCVTKDHPPYKPHPHNLVGRDGCKKGICTVEVHNETMTQSFDHLGIQCVKKKDIEEALRVRQEIRVDPFGTGFSHASQPGSIDLNAVRLSFQAFLLPSKIPLHPVVSDIIYDKKALCELSICKLSHCSAPVDGGLEMILLCEKVAKEDISVRLFEETNGELQWEGLGEFTPTQVHKQVAITFRTPKYKTVQIESPVQVFIQLRRPSDGETSDPLPFQLTPRGSGSLSGEQLQHKKRPRMNRGLIAEKDLLRVRTPQLSPARHIKIEPPEATQNSYLMFHPPSGHYRTPTPIMDVGSQFNPACPSTSTAYTVAESSICPTMGQPAVGSISPQQFQLPHNSPIYVPNGNIGELHETRTFIDMTSLKENMSIDNININSRDLQELNGLEDRNLSESLSMNLSLNGVLANTLQENMTDSFTKLANNAFNEFAT